MVVDSHVFGIVDHYWHICNMEQWKKIEGYENYQVSTYGNVRSLNFGHIGEVGLLKPQITKTGYYRVELYNKNGSRRFLVHRLVAQAFIPNPENLPHINHKDGCRTNNVVTNLEWCDPAYNNSYGDRVNRIVNTRSMRIIQLTLDGKYVGEYIGQGDASRKTGIPQPLISRVIRGKMTQTNGYRFIKK